METSATVIHQWNNV